MRRAECNGDVRPGGRLRRLKRRASVLASDQQGSAAIETALGLTVLITLMLGVIEFSMMTYTYAVYADAARKGVRYAVVHGNDSSICSGPSTGCTDSTATNVVNAVTSSVSNLSAQAASLNVNVTYPDGSCAPPSRVVVTVSYTYQPISSLSGLNHTFTTTSAGRIQY